MQAIRLVVDSIRDLLSDTPFVATRSIRPPDRQSKFSPRRTKAPASAEQLLPEQVDRGSDEAEVEAVTQPRLQTAKTGEVAAMHCLGSPDLDTDSPDLDTDKVAGGGFDDRVDLDVFLRSVVQELSRCPCHVSCLASSPMTKFSISGPTSESVRRSRPR